MYIEGRAIVTSGGMPSGGVAASPVLPVMPRAYRTKKHEKAFNRGQVRTWSLKRAIYVSAALEWRRVSIGLNKMATTKKTSNRPIFDYARAVESADKKAFADKVAAYKGFELAGATLESLSKDGAHWDDLKAGAAAAWLGVAGSSKVYASGDNKTLVTLSIVNRRGEVESTTKTKGVWKGLVTSKADKIRKAYVEWLKPDAAVPDAPKGAEDPAVLDPAAKPARAPNSKKALRDRIADDVTAMGNAILLDSKAKGDKGRQLTAEQAGELVNAFNVALTLVGVKKDKLIKQPAA